ncbi:uncharacterized protein VTP21DRAFT_2146 [Calcarisporiella thermophila]|uniref:uncharacterized protein n=1 Tax=Calcarisporiella thermophila TaxID=911321 RepID=UPI0037422DC9
MLTQKLPVSNPVNQQHDQKNGSSSAGAATDTSPTTTTTSSSTASQPHPPRDHIHIDPSQLVLTPADHEMLREAEHLKTRTLDYMVAPLEDIFDWDDLGRRLKSDGEWFVVAFRSIRSASADNELLFNADRMAHEEAKHSGGLLKYWYASLNERRECLAMCIWANRSWALLANKKPHHREAAKLAAVMYDSYILERYSLKKTGTKITLEKLPMRHH